MQETSKSIPKLLKNKRKRQDTSFDIDTASETENIVPKSSRVRIRNSQKTKKAKPIKKKEKLDSTFNLEEKYFYQSLTDDEWKVLNDDITSYLIGEEINLADVFNNQKLKKGNANQVMKLYICLI
jgi:hypothetical protein